MEETIIRTLPVKLTEEEQLEIGLNIAGNEIDIGKLEVEKSAMAKEFGDEIKGKWKENLDLSRTLKAGVKEEEVGCSWATDEPEPGQRQLYRNDIPEEKVGEPEPMNLFDGNTEENAADSGETENKHEETATVKNE